MSSRPGVQDPTHVAQSIRASRLAVGFASTVALARALNVAHSTVAHWEVGRHAPSSRYARRLAILLGEGNGGGWMGPIRP